jgi:hypothetical protein
MHKILFFLSTRNKKYCRKAKELLMMLEFQQHQISVNSIKKIFSHKITEKKKS